LVLNCVCFVVLVLGTAYGTQRFACRYYPRNSFGLKTLFVVTAIFAVAAWLGPSLFEEESRFRLYYLTLTVAAISAALTVVSAMHFAYRVFRRYSAAASVSPTAK
jgi:hypothetical protein